MMKYFSGLPHKIAGPMYEKTNRQIENLTEIIFFVIVRVTPICLVLLKCITSLFVYFTTDLKNNALELPLPMW